MSLSRGNTACSSCDARFKPLFPLLILIQLAFHSSLAISCVGRHGNQAMLSRSECNSNAVSVAGSTCWFAHRGPRVNERSSLLIAARSSNTVGRKWRRVVARTSCCRGLSPRVCPVSVLVSRTARLCRRGLAGKIASCPVVVHGDRRAERPPFPRFLPRLGSRR